MITTARSRRFPIRACVASRALAEIRAVAELSHRIRGTHDYQVRRDGLACEVRHVVELDSRPATRIWWLAVGRPLYDQLIEDAFDELARQTRTPVRRPARWAPYSRMVRFVASGRPRALTSAADRRPAEVLQLAG